MDVGDKLSEIYVKNLDKTVPFEEGESLLAVLVAGGVFVDNPCNGKGTCGKCRIKVLEGEIEEADENEKKLLKKDDPDRHIRLACMVDPIDGMVVETLHKERKHQFTTSGWMPDFEIDRRESGYGLSVDIGTTTVAVGLVDLTSGEQIDEASMINPQKIYGLDVLTRISYEYEHGEDGIRDLQESIVSGLNAMIDELVFETEIDKDDIAEICIAANCTMTHLLLGVDARPMGKYPYVPEVKDAVYIEARRVGLDVGEDTMLYCLPQVSAFIGADIVAGAYVCNMEKETGNTLFIDIGTNGEIVLAKDGELLCCSCAAGPALEGMNISSGMRAAEGAIEDVVISEDGIELKVIGDAEPVGLCGSGILAIVKELLRHKIVTSRGGFIKKDSLDEEDYRYDYIKLNGRKREFILNEDPEILVTQSDVRQVQLAKGAILSGFVALLNKAGLEMKDLDKVLIAGQFGAHLPEASLIGVGILPRDVENKLVYVGNSSKTGAYMCLMSERVRREIEHLAKKMHYVELAVTDDYEKIFRDSMLFPTFE
ncbi:MAG: ASKHA domain-containing protein [Peptoniphilus sp.]|nr:ASKHA domain-containing protein [Peptoniphilus sp.]MDD7362855.1 ASKHA domain-containing protein [Bacillota bacterium]MDY6043953.1 ASKHA domain-containing protein [Peptoniphilus sp.]